MQTISLAEQDNIDIKNGGIEIKKKILLPCDLNVKSK